MQLMPETQKDACVILKESGRDVRVPVRGWALVARILCDDGAQGRCTQCTHYGLSRTIPRAEQVVALIDQHGSGVLHIGVDDPRYVGAA